MNYIAAEIIPVLQFNRAFYKIDLYIGSKPYTQFKVGNEYKCKIENCDTGKKKTEEGLHDLLFDDKLFDMASKSSSTNHLKN